MPYVSQEIRHALDSGDEEPRTVGDLHYLIASLIDSYLDARDCSYATYNGVIGVLACAQHEVYRRIVAPYEDQKIIINGDVFGINRED